MSKLAVTLTSYNTGDATEEDFDRWVAYVDQRIDEQVGATVRVDASAFGAAQTDDGVRGGNPDQRQSVREALEVLWESWCANGAP